MSSLCCWSKAKGFSVLLFRRRLLSIGDPPYLALHPFDHHGGHGHHGGQGHQILLLLLSPVDLLWSPSHQLFILHLARGGGRELKEESRGGINEWFKARRITRGWRERNFDENWGGSHRNSLNQTALSLLPPGSSCMLLDFFFLQIYWTKYIFVSLFISVYPGLQ